MINYLPTKIVTSYVLGYQPHREASIYYLNIVPKEDANKLIVTFTNNLDEITAFGIINEKELSDAFRVKDYLKILPENCTVMTHLFPAMKEEDIEYIRDNLNIFEITRRIETTVCPQL
jgi:hypothetical protein